MSVSPIYKIIFMAMIADQQAIRVRLAGDTDPAVGLELTGLSDDLATARRCVVHIDLALAAFAGATLINFVLRLSGRLPGQSLLTLCLLGTTVFQLFALTSLDEVALVRVDPLTARTAPSAPVDVPAAVHAAALA